MAVPETSTLLALILCGAVGLLASGMIALQDFMARAVHVFWLLLLLGAGVGSSILLWPDRTMAYGFGYLPIVFNACFLTMVLLVLACYLRIRRMGFIDRTFGLGDLVFLYAAACWLGPFSFVLYFVTGTGLSIAFPLVFGRSGPEALAGGYAVPYAGVLAVLLPLAVAVDWGLG